jgi:hypothetical protein
MITANPNLSVRRVANQLNINRGTVLKILKKDLNLHPYRMKIVQELSPVDYDKRMSFSRWFLEQVNRDQSFVDTLITSDEAHFHLNGFVNRQNCRYWCDHNPEEIVQVPLHPTRVTVWCALSSSGIIGPYFFEDCEGKAVTVNSERYSKMLEDFFLPEIRRNNLQNHWMQQDGATAHTARPSMDVLRREFPNRLISRFGDVNWPSRSPDLSPPDFFLWGYLKNRVYRNSPTSLQDLKNKITSEIQDINVATLRAVMQAMLKKMQECLEAEGAHLKSSIFKT